MWKLSSQKFQRTWEYVLGAEPKEVCINTIITLVSFPDSQLYELGSGNEIVPFSHSGKIWRLALHWCPDSRPSPARWKKTKKTKLNKSLFSTINISTADKMLSPVPSPKQSPDSQSYCSDVARSNAQIHGCTDLHHFHLRPPCRRRHSWTPQTSPGEGRKNWGTEIQCEGNMLLQMLVKFGTQLREKCAIYFFQVWIMHFLSALRFLLAC